MIEVKGVRQIPEEGFRRWFMDKDMDLILWYDEENSPVPIGFQISYDKRSVQRTVTWKSGEKGRNSSSLTCDGPYNSSRLIRLLEKNGSRLNDHILPFVLEQLRSKAS